MQRYVEQLIEELRAARSIHVELPLIDLDEEFLQIPAIRAAEEFLAGPVGTLASIFKIDRKLFPPDNRLTDEQVILITSEILSLLMAHRFAADFPENIEPRDAYNALLRRWNKPIPYVSDGHCHLEFWNDKELAKYYPEDAEEDAAADADGAGADDDDVTDEDDVGIEGVSGGR
jgi:hypothetical protein